MEKERESKEYLDKFEIVVLQETWLERERERERLDKENEQAA